MSFLVVDSGSTKADWVWHDGQKQQILSTHGINPTTGSGMHLDLPAELKEVIHQASTIYFYAAGGLGEMAEKNMLDYFASITRVEDKKIYVYSDMLGAARACAGDEPAIIGILGTGSNSCLYDGKNIIDQIPSLGYLLSDEGSGNHLGKLILKAWFYRSMSNEDAQKFNDAYHLTREKCLQEIYSKEGVSAYLAGFAPFLNSCSNELKINILNTAFKEFIEVRIIQYADFRNFALYFAGSIAATYEKELAEVCKTYGLQIKAVVRKPVDDLLKYHLSRQIR